MILVYLLAAFAFGAAVASLCFYTFYRGAANTWSVRETMFQRENENLQAVLQTVRDESATREKEKDEFRQKELQHLKDEFTLLSNRIFEEKSSKLANNNNEMLSQLLNPLKDKLAEFKTSVEEAKSKNIEINAALRNELSVMLNEAKKLGNEANMLSNALRGTQKTQGDWGEMILEEILKRSGLKPGIHYECQKTLRDRDGNLLKTENNNYLRPDLIVHYPDGRDVVIDSKVSLTAYITFVNSEDDNQRRQAAKEHLQSVKKHIDELARKDYDKFIPDTGNNSIGFTVMFIPNEGSYQQAMISDESLWNYAFERRVLIVSPVNLTALLQIIYLAWVKDDQNRNQQEILKTAGEMLDRLYAFYDEFDGVGKKLDDAAKAFDTAAKRLKDGHGTHNIVKSGEKLKALGVKLSKPRKLPKTFETGESDLIAEIPMEK